MSRSLRGCLFLGPSLHSPRPCQRTVWRGSLAPPCGHFASLVRSIAPQSARVPSETLRVSAAHLASHKTGKPPPLPAHSFYCRSICGWREGSLKAYPPEAPQREESFELSEGVILRRSTENDLRCAYVAAAFRSTLATTSPARAKPKMAVVWATVPLMRALREHHSCSASVGSPGPGPFGQTH